MSAPRKIWADQISLHWMEAGTRPVKAECQHLYHHDDAVRELAVTLERAEMVMRMRGHLEMADECAAALARIAQERAPDP